MKFYYIIFNIFLLLMAGTLIFLHVKHKKPITKISPTPKSAITSSIDRSIWEKLNRRPSAQNKDLAKDNLFEPKRGYVAPTPKVEETKKIDPKEEKNIELVGVMKINSYAVAFIENKNRNAEQKTFYNVGTEVHNGWKVKSIDTDKVILTDGKNGTFKLTLDRADDNSKKRSQSLKYTAPTRKSTEKTAPAKTKSQQRLEALRKKRASRFKRK